MSIKDRLVDLIVAAFNPNNNRSHDSRMLSEAVVGEGRFHSMRIRFMSGNNGVYCIVEARVGLGDNVIIEINEEQTLDVCCNMLLAYKEKGVKISMP